MDRLGSYVPFDRLDALARGDTLPDRTYGAALFADISGFTPLTEHLVTTLGPRRGAEELTHHLSRVYEALISELQPFRGSVIGFAGDAIWCWFNGDDGQCAIASALAMQRAMTAFSAVAISTGATVSLGMKTAVASGAARRFLVGDPDIQHVDVLAGTIMDRLAAAEHHARRGEVITDDQTLAALKGEVQLLETRGDESGEHHFGIIAGLKRQPELTPWPDQLSETLTPEQLRPWLLPPVYNRLQSGQGDFLAELRPISALFLHFSGIDYDGDDSAGDKLDAYVRQVQNILKRYEANLLQVTIGDKGSFLYSAFGAPLAHEDDAVRAASAAIDLLALTPNLDFIRDVQIGVTQGRTYTGALGSNIRRTYAVMGDDVNLAARLMQAATPGQILVSKTLRQAAGDDFVWEDLPDIRVKGKSEPIGVSALNGRARRRSMRLQMPNYALPMVGRETQLVQIEEKLSTALQGRGQIIGITAEAGMGKSRLVTEVVRLASERGLVGFDGECQSYGTNTRYLVWHNIWQGIFGLDPSMALDEQMQLLEAHLARIDTALLPRLPLLGPLLNITIPDNDLTRTLDGQLRKSSLESLLVDCLRSFANQQPLLLVLEDCHWIDPLSYELLEVIGRTIANLPALIVMAYRLPELELMQAPAGSRLPHFTEIRLSEFTSQEADQLIHLKLHQLYGAHVNVPEALVKRITERAEGNPFYVEELLNYLQDRGIDLHDVDAISALDLPNSLHSLILSRIDQLTESQKITLKLASVVGRLFRATMLWGAYTQLGEIERVKSDLDVLTRLELTQLDPEPELTYLFKHIITQEVAYESLPFAMRASLHDQIAQYIERTYHSSLSQVLDLLAYHYGRSDNSPKKREYLLKAGEAAQATYANSAAIDYYQRVLALLPEAEQIGVMLRLGKVHDLLGNWDQAAELYQQALQAAARLGDRRAVAQCREAIGELFRKQGQYAEATRMLEKARAEFEQLGDKAGLGQTLHSAGTVAAQQGDYPAAKVLYDISLKLRRELDDQPKIADLLHNLAIVSRLEGNTTQARTLQEEALTIRSRLGDRRAIGLSLNNLGNVALDQGDYTEARARLEEAVMLQREVGDKYYIANALNNLGNVTRAQGDYDTTRKLYTESLLINRELGDGWQLAYVIEDIGGLAALQGQAERALKLVGAASALREEIGSPLSPAEQTKLEHTLEPARQALSEAMQEQAWAEGRALSLEEAIDYALNDERVRPVM